MAISRDKQTCYIVHASTETTQFYTTQTCSSYAVPDNLILKNVTN